VSEYAAIQAAETAKAVYVQEQARSLAELEKQQAVETATIAQEQAVAVARAAKLKAEKEALIAAEKAQQEAEVDRQRAIAVALGAKEIAVIENQEQQARAQAAKALAIADQEQANQAVATVQATAAANREKAVAVIGAEAEAAVKIADAQGRAAAAEREAYVTVTLANALAARAAAEAEARRRMVDAENAVGMKLVLRDVAMKAIESMPDLARELMAPAKAISEIKVLQTGSAGLGGSTTAQPALGAMSPILKTILEAGAAYPLFRELLGFAQVDGDKLKERARAALAEAAGEVRAVVAAEEPVELDASEVVGPLTSREANGTANGAASKS
jgi:uncharacterized membrane protein YqiK